VKAETRPVVERPIVRHASGAARAEADRLAVEEPLEIRLDDAPVAVVMRTPGDDFELAVGFLLAEGLVLEPEEVAGVSYCRDPEAGPGPTNVVSVATPGAAAAERVAARRRVVVTGSACGLCGRTSLEEVHRRLPRPGAPPELAPADLHRALRRLAASQPAFAETGATHGAAILDAGGAPVAVFEDVGRHNAVDKCVGQLALRGALPATGHLLCVSGRVSFEIVQKALAAGIPAVAAVGGATSLAVDLAQSAGLLLAGFVREDRCTVYGGTLFEG
jgi:FdhD protein